MGNSNRRSSFIWPDVSTPEQARSAANGGAIAACIIVVITSGLALYAILKSPVLNVTAWSFVDAFLFAVVGIGIWKLSRVAAVAGLVLYLIEQVALWSSPGPKPTVMAVLFILLFVHAIRGTFSYHRLTKAVPEANAT